MKTGFLRTIEAMVAVASTYMAAVTMIQTTLYHKLLEKLVGSPFGPWVEGNLSLINLAIILALVAASFTFWKRGDEAGFSRIFNLNMLLFFPSILDYSTFNWVGLIFDLEPTPGVSHLWVFMVGLLLQVTYLMLRYTIRIRHTWQELEARGAEEPDLENIARGQLGYLSLLTCLTALITAGVYWAAPRIAEAAAKPLSQLSTPHLAAGIAVVATLGASLVFYLRGEA